MMQKFDHNSFLQQSVNFHQTLKEYQVVLYYMELQSLLALYRTIQCSTFFLLISTQLSILDKKLLLFQLGRGDEPILGGRFAIRLPQVQLEQLGKGIVSFLVNQFFLHSYQIRLLLLCLKPPEPQQLIFFQKLGQDHHVKY